ncbi:uncharacterized protein TRUGW13939_03569 [Talaromyces rugulosus]|uniref:mRNA stability protein n=1 Tax=Talaromyces rugulosus TaxID=121627 RepID=A0A7H8QR54_TALRU|nr:uncharacterized protein TRUGW13939_03569 [Talaromyces rugulosus]QKX56464.1 hypothetical protein TRUGW13939_03569 [Talaromyces rugulosus]
MNPHQQNKVDISSLSPDEQRLLRLYGKVPTKKDLLQNKLKERKYFDSGDYALSKAGKASDIGVTNVGSRHPVPENIPHLTSTSPGTNNPAGNNGNNGGGGAAGGGNAGPGTTVTQANPIPGTVSGHPGSVSFQNRSPIKEASFLQRGTGVDESEKPSEEGQKENDDASVSPPPAKEGVPIPQ